VPNLAPVFCRGGAAIAIDGRVLDVASGALLAEPTDADARVISQAISGDGERLAFCSATTAEILEAASGARLHSLSIADIADHSAALKSVVFHSDGSVLVSLQQQSQVSVWRLESTEKLCEFPARFAEGIFFSPAGRWICTREWPDTGSPVVEIRIHDIRSGQLVVLVHDSIAGSLKFMPDENSCIVGSGTQAAARWDLQTRGKVTTFAGHQQEILDIELLDNGTVLETRSSDRARRWNPVTGELLMEFLNPFPIDDRGDHYLATQTGITRSIAVKPSQNGSVFLAGNVVIDGHSKRGLQTLNPRPGSVGDMLLNLGHRVLSSDGSRLVIEYDDPARRRMVHLRDPRTAELISRLTTDAIGARDVIWSHDAQRAVTIGDGYFCLFDVSTGRPLLAQRYNRASDWTIAFSPGGRFLYCHDLYTRLVLWKADSGELWNPAALAKKDTTAGSGSASLNEWDGFSLISPDGRLAFSSQAAVPTHNDSSRKQWRLWDLQRGEILPAFVPGPGEFRRAFFSADSRYMAVPYRRQSGTPASRKHFYVIEMWDLQTQRKLYDLQLPAELWRMASVFFLPNNEQILINGAGRSLFLADLHSGELLRTLTDTDSASADAVDRRVKFLRPDVLISPDSRWAVADYDTSYTIIWNLQTGDPYQLIREGNGSIDASVRFRFNKEGDRLLLAYSRDKRILDLASGEELPIGNFDIRNLSEFSSERPPNRPPDRPAVPAEIVSQLIDQFPAAATDQHLTADGSRLIAYHGDASVTLWDVASSEMLARCYILDRGKAFLTVDAAGTIRGNHKFVRQRVPGSIQIVPGPAVSQLKAIPRTN
jgi:WD40 repeat protein